MKLESLCAWKTGKLVNTKKILSKLIEGIFMKKRIYLSLLFFCLSSFIFAQVSVNPQHEFYSHVKRWDTLGLIQNIPQYRPYPVNVVDEILNTVIESENESESNTAKELYEEIHRRSFKPKSESAANIKLAENNSKQIYDYFGVDGDISFNSLLSAGYNLDCIVTTSSSLNSLPLYSREIFFFRDMAGFGPVSGSLETDGTISFGKKNIYLSTGVNHSSFGPFYSDSITLADESKHTPTFAFSWRPGAFQYNQLLLVLTATNLKNQLFSNKYLFLHSIGYTPVKNFNFNFYEVSILGGRIDPSYLVPIFYITTEGISGYDDNILMGLNFNWKPFNGFSWTGDFLLDDIGFCMDTSESDFTMKLHAAIQTGVQYVPSKLKWLSALNADYTIVTPYMYSHWENSINTATGSRTYLPVETAINYQEYTTAGSPLGSSLDPNSDRIQLKASFTPVKNLNVDFKGVFIRHANENEGLTLKEQLSYLRAPKGYFVTDGSIHNNIKYWTGTSDGNLYSAQNRIMLLTQDTIQYTLQLGTKASYTFPKTKAGIFTISLGYTFEFIKNYGVSNEIFKGWGTLENDGTVTYEGGIAPTEADVYAALEAWRSQLTDVINNYISINFKYVF